jgi:hypothetical protein
MSFAVLLILFNKAALSSYNFPSANVITLFQVDLPELTCCILLFAILIRMFYVFYAFIVNGCLGNIIATFHTLVLFPRR